MRLQNTLPFAILVSFGLTSAALAKDTSIDCEKAHTVDEKTICSNYRLGQLDARMATLFEVSTSLVAMGQRGDIRDEQVEWLKSRHACGSDVECLGKAYETRIAQLQKVIEHIASRGPY